MCKWVFRFLERKIHNHNPLSHKKRKWAQPEEYILEPDIELLKRWQNLALLADGTLAGSILKINDSYKNIIKFTQVSFLEAVQTASANPAKQLNIFDRKGSIEVGKDADLMILSSDYEVELTICRGKIAYKREDMD